MDQVSIQVKQGDIYGLIGRNGAGKTSLMKIIGGLTRQTSGDYSFFGEDSSDLGLGKLRIGSLIENPGTYPKLNAKDHIELKAKAMGLRGKDLAEKSLDQVGLADAMKKPVKEFSLGMKQRLGIAMALLGSPDLVLLDEPMSGLDPQGIAEIRSLIRDLNEKDHVTFMISSHILGELQKLATRFGIIEEGQVLDEIDRETLAKKNRDRIELATSDSAKALPLLDGIGIHQYKLVSPEMIYIFEGLDRTGDIALAMAKAGLPIQSISFHSRSLEEYYLGLNPAGHKMYGAQTFEEEF